MTRERESKREEREGSILTGKRKVAALFLIAVTSLTLSLGALEGVLEVGGQLYKYSRSNDPAWSRISMRKGKEVVNVLAIGDSFTFGGSGLSNKSYPGYLDRFLKRKSPDGFLVTNHGVCESTSKDLLKNLYGLTTFARPDVVLVLTGAANLFDPYPFADEVMSVFQHYDNFIRRRHVYKLFRHLYFETLLRFRRWRSEGQLRSEAGDSGQTDGYLAALQLLKSRLAGHSLENQRSWLAEAGRTSPAAGELSRGLLSYLDGDNEGALSVFQKVRKVVAVERPEAPQDRFYGPLRETLSRITPAADTRSNLRLQLFLLRIGFTEATRHVVENVLRMYQYDSTLDPRLALDAIDKALEQDPALYRNQRLRVARMALANLKEWRRHVGIWYEENIREVVARLRRDSIEVVLQTYPIPYGPINRITRSVAKELNVPLVDHELVFAPLIAANWKRYLVDDQHCTDLGHELMARNVLSVLEQQYLGDPAKVISLRRHFSDYR